MPLDLDDALRNLADGPIPPVDTHEIVRTARRRRRLTRATVGLAVIGLLVGLVVVLEQFQPTAVPIVGAVDDAPTTSINSPTSLCDNSPQATTGTANPVPRFDGVPGGWDPLPALPATRSRPAAVWTGTQLIAVGGDNIFSGRPHRDTFLFEPSTGHWACAGAAPFGAGAEDAVWTGERLLLYGNDRAAAYRPAARTWEPLPTPPADAPHEPFANVWTGDEWIVWGTTSRSATHGRGVAFDPASGEWREMPPAPVGLDQGNGIWTGDELIVFGADLDEGNYSSTPQAVGAAYDPASDSWRRLPYVDLSPQAAGVARTVGSAVLAYDDDTGAALYHPDENRWKKLDQIPVESGECPPRSATLGDGSVFLWYCGQAAVFDPTTNTFDEIETPITTHWGRPPADGEVETVPGTLAATDNAVYFIGSPYNEGQADVTWRWQSAH